MIKELKNTYYLYEYYNIIKKDIPYWFNIDFENWCKSMFDDTDYYNQTLFKKLHTYISINEGLIDGFIQFGIPKFILNENGDKDTQTKAGIIRNLYYKEDNQEVGNELINTALNFFKDNDIEKEFAFYHYFGMTCNACHGKLYNKNFYIEKTLFEFGYKKEHENVYFKKIITNNDMHNSNNIKISYEKINEKGLCDFSIIYNDIKIGAGILCYLPQGKICYLKLIYIFEEHKHKGHGTNAIKKII